MHRKKPKAKQGVNPPLPPAKPALIDRLEKMAAVTLAIPAFGSSVEIPYVIASFVSDSFEGLPLATQYSEVEQASRFALDQYANLSETVQKFLDKTKARFEDPVTLEEIRNPVVASDGQTYEEKSENFTEIVVAGKASPLTRTPFQARTHHHSVTLKNICDDAKSLQSVENIQASFFRWQSGILIAAREHQRKVMQFQGDLKNFSDEEKTLLQTIRAAESAAEKRDIIDFLFAVFRDNQPKELMHSLINEFKIHPDLRGSKGDSLLSLSVACLNLLNFNAILEHRPDVNLKLSPKGETVLHSVFSKLVFLRCVSLGDPINPSPEILKNVLSIMEKLLKAGADPNSLDYSGASVLGLAVELGHTGCIKRLLEYGADPELGVDAAGRSNYDLATPEILKILPARKVVPKAQSSNALKHLVRQSDEQFKKAVAIYSRFQDEKGVLRYIAPMIATDGKMYDQNADGDKLAKMEEKAREKETSIAILEKIKLKKSPDAIFDEKNFSKLKSEFKKSSAVFFKSIDLQQIANIVFSQEQKQQSENQDFKEHDFPIEKLQQLEKALKLAKKKRESLQKGLKDQQNQFKLFESLKDRGQPFQMNEIVVQLMGTLIEWGDKAALKFLLDRGVVPKQTLLLLAIWYRQKGMCSILAGYGLGVNFLAANDYTPLHFAALPCSMSSLDTYAEASDLLYKKKSAESLADHKFEEVAVERDVMVELLDLKAEVNSKTDDGNTPLHLAVLCGQSEKAKVLLARGADPDLANNAGKTSKHYLSKLKGERQLKMLNVFKNYKKPEGPPAPKPSP